MTRRCDTDEKYGQKPETEICKTVSLVIDGCYTTSELVKRGNYTWVNNFVCDEKFPLEFHKPVNQTIELVKFNHSPTTTEVFQEFVRRGLKRPTFEDMLYFGVKHPEEQRTYTIVFLHEPVPNSDGLSCVFVLHGRASIRYFDLHYWGGEWGRGCVFAGVRKS